MAARSPADVDLGRLEGALGFLLRLAQLRTQARFFEENAEADFKPGEFTVLWVIWHNPGIRQSVLGQKLMIKRAHMTKLVRSLEDRGLVTRRIPEDDRRAVELTLSTGAETQMKRAETRFFAFEERIGAPLSKTEVEQLNVLLRKFLGLG
ncbi:MarR family winged helix-turn-helix transcriptional regulator [Pelagibacterium sediminicola]|uniref:MarR family winged helix-turn-helix transcriptional regulator n=1 Tax=Pelagibacterium sediminicola TaxID=2248761 RepID=UPI000E31DFDD|nr:MarR family winged helix-turn-helix transcriptional regulator [Pelagibacterium sediminicola]